MDAFDLTWGQQALYDHMVVNNFDLPDSLFGEVWPVPPGTGPERVMAALKALVERHEPLRTTYLEGPPARQVVRPTAPVPVSRLAVAPAVADVVRGFVFDHGDPSPLKAVLIGPDRDPRAVLVTVPHMSVDFAGFGILRSEFHALLAGAPLPPALQPRDQVALEASPRMRAGSDAARDYIAAALDRTPEVFLCTRRPRSTMAITHVHATSWRIAACLRRLSGETGVSVPTVMATMVALVLSACAGERAALLRAIYSRRHLLRDRPYIAPQILPVLVHLDLDAPTVRSLLRTARRSAMKAYAHGNYDPAVLYGCEARKADALGAPIDGYCQFNFMGELDDECIERPTRIRTADSAPMFMPYRFACTCFAGTPAGAVEVEVTYDQALMDVTARAFVERLERVLASAAANPDAPAWAGL